MIIKIKAPSDNEGWWVFDNARGVFFSRVPLARAHWREVMGVEAPMNMCATHEDNPCHTTGSFFDTQQCGTDCAGFYLTFERGEAETYEFFGETEAYLLSDNGKTIERIN